MSFTSSQLHYQVVNRKWKNFIKETPVKSAEAAATYHSQLNFNGDEAKFIYDQIINDDSKVKQCYQDEKIKNNLSLKERNVKNKRVSRNASHNNDTVVNINKILGAVECGDIKFLKAHLTKDNVNTVDIYGWTPLMSAAYCGNESIVEFLMRLGANRELKDKSGLSAFQLAQKKNHDKILKLLRIEKPNDNKKNYSPKSFEFTEFYCSVCKANFNNTTLTKHETSTLHLFNTNPKLPDPIYGISDKNKGYQIMINNGWEKTRGLGPSGIGLKYPIKTILKRDRKGFGHAPKHQARVTHFKSGDVNAIRYPHQLKIKNNIENQICKRDREKLNYWERRKEIAIRRALC